MTKRLSLLTNHSYTYLIIIADNKQTMEITLFTCWRRILQLLLLCTLLLVIVPSSRYYCEGVVDLVSQCHRKRTAVTVKYGDDCEPATTNVYVCHGACVTSMTMIPDPPYQNTTCNLCRATQFRTKVKKVLFNCGGQSIEKRVYYSHVEECGCVGTAGL